MRPDLPSAQSGGTSRTHAYSFFAPPQDPEWHVFEGLAPLVADALDDGAVGPGPDPFFSGADVCKATEVVIGDGGLAVRGRGIHRKRRGETARPMCGAPLYLSRHLRGWTCRTAGKPYDGAVRLVLLLLHEAMPETVRLRSDGTGAEWTETEALASDLLHRRVIRPRSLRRVEPAPAAAAAPFRVPYPPSEEAAIDFAEHDPGIRVRPSVPQGDLWKAFVDGVEVAPVGGLATVYAGRRGFNGRTAALLAAAEAADSIRGNLPIHAATMAQPFWNVL